MSAPTSAYPHIYEPQTVTSRRKPAAPGTGSCRALSAAILSFLLCCKDKIPVSPHLVRIIIGSFRTIHTQSFNHRNYQIGAIWQIPQDPLIFLAKDPLGCPIFPIPGFNLSFYSRKDKSGIKKNRQRVKNVSIFDKISAGKSTELYFLFLMLYNLFRG